MAAVVVELATFALGTGQRKRGAKPVTAYVTNQAAMRRRWLQWGPPIAPAADPRRRRPGRDCDHRGRQDPYVTELGSGTVTPIDLATKIVGTLIRVGIQAVGTAIIPTSKTAYVTNDITNPAGIAIIPAPLIAGTSDRRVRTWIILGQPARIISDWN